MKRVVGFQLVALGMAIMALGLCSCSKESNPFDPIAANGNGASARNLPVVTSATATGLIATDDVIEIEFDQFMLESLLEAPGNVTLFNVTTDTPVLPSPRAPAGLTLVYEPENRRLYVSPAGGVLPDDSAFLLSIKNTVTNLTGQALDGDGDTRAEGTPYDDYRIPYYTGAGLADYNDIRTTAPTITSTDPPLDGSGGVAVAATITVNFSADIDATTLGAGNFHLVEAVSGTAVSLEQFPVLPGPTATSVTLRPVGGAPLANATVYRFTIDPGVIKAPVDATGDATSCLRNLDLDGDGPEATESARELEFLTVEAPGGDATPPHVTSFSNPSAGDEWFEVRFSEEMDVTTFTHQNIRLTRTSGGSVVTTGQIIPDEDGEGFRYTLENATVGAHYDLNISRKVADVAGWQLDSDWDGLGGEPEDDFYLGFTY